MARCAPLRRLFLCSKFPLLNASMDYPCPCSYQTVTSKQSGSCRDTLSLVTVTQRQEGPEEIESCLSVADHGWSGSINTYLTRPIPLSFLGFGYKHCSHKVRKLCPHVYIYRTSNSYCRDSTYISKAAIRNISLISFLPVEYS